MERRTCLLDRGDAGADPDDRSIRPRDLSSKNKRILEVSLLSGSSILRSQPQSAGGKSSGIGLKKARISYISNASASLRIVSVLHFRNSFWPFSYFDRLTRWIPVRSDSSAIVIPLASRILFKLFMFGFLLKFSSIYIRGRITM